MLFFLEDSFDSVFSNSLPLKKEYILSKNPIFITLDNFPQRYEIVFIYLSF